MTDKSSSCCWGKVGERKCFLLSLGEILPEPVKVFIKKGFLGRIKIWTEINKKRREFVGKWKIAWGSKVSFQKVASSGLSGVRTEAIGMGGPEAPIGTLEKSPGKRHEGAWAWHVSRGEQAQPSSCRSRQHTVGRTLPFQAKTLESGS